MMFARAAQGMLKQRAAAAAASAVAQKRRENALRDEYEMDEEIMCKVKIKLIRHAQTISKTNSRKWAAEEKLGEKSGRKICRAAGALFVNYYITRTLISGDVSK